jgi:hypothetical protein
MRLSTEPSPALAFLDAGPLIALADRGDPRHEASRAYFARAGSRLVTHVGVLAEVVTFVRYRFGHPAARRIGDGVRAGLGVDLLPIDLADEREGWRWFLRYRDQRFSLVDCWSFAIMERLGIREVVTFDHHFAVAGFNPVLPVAT